MRVNLSCSTNHPFLFTPCSLLLTCYGDAARLPHSLLLDENHPERELSVIPAPLYHSQFLGSPSYLYPEVWGTHTWERLSGTTQPNRHAAFMRLRGSSHNLGMGSTRLLSYVTALVAIQVHACGYRPAFPCGSRSLESPSRM